MTTPAWLQDARREGLLPPEAAPHPIPSRPWPVVLLTALGAWFAAVPLMAFVALLLEDALPEMVAPYVGAAVLLPAAIGVLRRSGAAAFAEQLAFAALVSGAGLLGYGLARDLPTGPAAALLALLIAMAARAVPRPWLRALLGTSAAPLCMVAIWPHDAQWTGPLHGWALWLVPHGVLALWALLHLAAPRWLGTPRAARTVLAMEQFSHGWLLATLVLLALFSGPTLLLGDALGAGPAAGLFHELPAGLSSGRMGLAWPQVGSALLACAAALLLARAWPGLRRAPAAGVAGVLVLLGGMLPNLGAVLFAAALLLRRGHWRLAGAAAVAGAWIVGSFYYLLDWPLATKAAWLVGMGALLAAMAWWTSRREPGHRPRPAPGLRGSHPRAAPWLLLAGAGATLVVAQLAIHDKEQLIAKGQTLFVALAPVDPRSLVQGDYMRLRFALPVELPEDSAAFAGGARPRIVLRRDHRGVATPLRLYRSGEPLASGELLMALSPKNGGWVLVSDAWFFREGEAARFEQARYGEFRVQSDGRALLVGMADEELQPIAP